ncbi:MAG: PIG-L family deacetylase [Phascolarctobacterium sp.]|nr:PIG-L family deacetylase [Phascolarctobacterium sp.]
MFFSCATTKKVFIIVPHQDDELNLIGGFLPLLRTYNIECYVTYSINGAYDKATQNRYQEAINALAHLDVDKEHIIFLGYPDRTGAIENPNLTNDLEKLILEHQPDVIFAVDLDEHPDHIMTSNAFHSAITEIQKKKPCYHPTIFKGFCYSTAFKAYKDYYNLNLLSTRLPTGKHLAPWTKTELDNPNYHWCNRIRFPVDTKTAIIPLRNNLLFQAIKEHRSQLLRIEAKKIINGDNVFWEINPQSQKPFAFAKILIDGNFTYDTYYVHHTNSLHLEVYTYGINKELSLSINDTPLPCANTKLNLDNFDNKKIIVKLTDKNAVIYDTVEIIRINYFDVLYKKIQWLWDRLWNYIHYKYDKIFLPRRTK